MKNSMQTTLPHFNFSVTAELNDVTSRLIILINEEINSVALYATEERSPKMKNSTQTTLPHFNFSVTAELNDVTSRLIILISEEINKANCMVRDSAKLDCRTKQHTQYGVSASNGSRDMALTKSWRKKQEKEKKKKENNKANWMVSNSAKLDCRTKQHTQFGVSASNGSRDMARTKSWRKKQKNK